MTAAETPFESRSSRDGQRDLALLRSFLASYRALGLVMGVVVAAISLAEPSPWILLIAATAFTYAAVLTVARRWAAAGNVGRAVVLVNLTVWPLTLLGALVAPISFPIQAVSGVPAALIAVAYLPLRAGRRLLVITAIATVVITAICRFVSVVHVADRVNQYVIDAVLLSLLPGLVVLISAIGWQSHRVLDERATELDHSRSRVLAAAGEERRRVDNDLRETAKRRIESALVQLEFAFDAGSPPELLVEGGPSSLRFSATVEVPRPGDIVGLEMVVTAIDDRLATVDGYATLDCAEQTGRLTIHGTIPTTAPRTAQS